MNCNNVIKTFGWMVKAGIPDLHEDEEHLVHCLSYIYKTSSIYLIFLTC